MSNYCPVGCATDLGQRYDAQAGYCPTKRKKGNNQFIGFKCSFAGFANILDLAEWDAGIQSGEIYLSPCGILAADRPTTQILQEGNECQPDIIDCVTTPFNFQTPYVAEDYSDEDWWCNFFDTYQLHSFGYLSCVSERIVLPKALVTAIKASLSGGGNAVPASGRFGFKLNITDVPDFINGPNNKNGLWDFSGEFEDSGVTTSVEIPGLYDLFQTLGA